MLKLYNKEHEVLSALTNLKDYKIEYVLSGEDLLEFSLSRYDENIPLIEEECYIRTKYNEYVIKAIEPSDNFKRFTCNINIESLVGKVIKNFDTKNNNINDTIRLAISGTGWILADNNITKRRTVTLKNTNALEVLRKVREAFRVDFRFDAINKIIYVYEKLGSDKGVYFTDELNLISLDVPSDSYDYATRLYVKGKDGLTFANINNGKDYIENFQYSSKVIEKIWEDNRYTDENSLKEDAEAKLEELSKPKRNYNVQVYDLAKNNSEFSFLDFSIGDTVTIISNLEKFKDKQRIVKYIEYPEDPSQNTCELGNTTLTFEELQKENEAKNQVVDNITSDNNTVDGSKVDSITTEQISDFEAEVAKITDLTVINAEITNLKAENVTITGKLNAIEGEFGTLKANVGVIDKLTVTHTAQINDLKANSATITQLEAVSAKIGTVEAEVGKIQTLVNGNLSSENIQAGGITSDKLTIANGFITNAMIANLDVSKINAGDISTNKFKIKSDDGGIEIIGATQQFKDKNNKVRIQMGQDAKGNFNFIIRDEDGTTTLIDHTGIKEKAIADDLIKNNMISEDAVGEKQINYSSFITGFNKDTNTSTIKSTKIHLNNQNQTLEVAFNSLKTQADGTKSLTESHSTTIGVMQGQITTSINNTQIVKDGQTILLKDDYNRTVATVDSMESTIGSHTTTINEHTGKITGVETRVNTVERDLNSITVRVSSTETKVTTITNTANAANSNATNALNTANSANSKVDGLQVGGRNLILNSALNGNTNWIGATVDTSKKYENCNSLKFTGSASAYSSSTPAKVGEVFTVSVKSFVGTSGGNLPLIIFEEYKDSTTARINYQETTVPSTINSWQTYKATWTVKNSQTTNVRIRIYNRTASYNFWASQPKLEKGNKATDWTPAPEDTQTQIDANKTEISSTKSKVSTIETNLSGITQRVSTVEQKQTTVDGKVTSLETWKKSAEQKITDASIISTVSSQFYKKGETDSKYATKSLVTQTANDVRYEFQQYGSHPNLMINGCPKYNNYKHSGWYTQDSWVDSSTNTFRFATYTDGGYNEGFLYSPQINVTPNTTYSLSYWLEIESNVHSHDCFIWEIDKNGNWLYTQHIVTSTDHWWRKYNKTFTTGPNTYKVIVRFDHNGYIVNNGSKIWCYLDYVMLCKGSEIYPINWYPCAEEVIGDTSIINGNGVVVTHTNGSYTQISSRGLEHWENGMARPYHYMFDCIIVDCNGKCNGTWFKVQLPSIWKGKDFTVAWQAGNYSSPYGRVVAGVEVNCRNKDIWNATVEVQMIVYTKGEWPGSSLADVNAYGWCKLFLMY